MLYDNLVANNYGGNKVAVKNLFLIFIVYFLSHERFLKNTPFKSLQTCPEMSENEGGVGDTSYLIHQGSPQQQR